MTLAELEQQCQAFLEGRLQTDAAHDLDHVRRVVKNCTYLTEIEDANFFVTIPAAWLHDCVTLPKNSPDRARSSQVAAGTAIEFLARITWPEELLPEIYHAIEAHSFSAGIPARSVEARVVQDADRLDALGAIGIARCALTGASLGSALYRAEDPFCDARDPDDRAYVIDHFYAKLLKLPDTMQTESGRAEAHRRAKVMLDYLEQLRKEIS